MQTSKINGHQSTNLNHAYLISSNDSKEVITLQDFCTIGRGEQNTLCIHDPFVSKRHARIEKRGSTYIIKDLRSSNGTFLNETPVLEAQLKSNDQLRLGESLWTFSSSKEPQATLPSSKNAQWQAQLERLPAFAATDHTVLVLGPSGSGKELVSQWVHSLSPRKQGPFVAINCSALSEQLIESELFGHMEGSFTGAANDREGAFESARAGTLFLDEIGDLPMSLQPKLLRALENQEIRPVGSDRVIKTNVRVVAATHKNLYEKVLAKEFREDLYHRLNVCKITPPSLLDRMEDFEQLLYDMAKKHKVRFSFSAIENLKNHSWPGNIRELKNTIIRASAYFPAQKIESQHLKDILSFQETTVPLAAIELPPLKELERDMIVRSLQKYRGNQRQTADDLKMPKSTLHDKLKTYNIDVKKFKPRGRTVID